MKHRILASIALLACAAGAEWLQFRGTDQRGRAHVSKLPPTEWSVGPEGAEKKNVAWTVDLPIRGVSGPILVGDRVIVTGASGANQEKLQVACYAAADGRLLWDRRFWATGRTLCHPTSSVAAPTPASDGKRIFAFFSSNDLVCLGLDGEMLWYRGLTLEHPTAANDVGMASSPLVVGDTVVVQVESKGESFAAGLDAATGETRWSVDRPADMNWSSPTAMRSGDGTLVLLQSPTVLSAHDPKTGETQWTFQTVTGGISSPTAVGEMIYLPGDAAMTALRVSPGSANWETVWNQNELKTGSPSPVVDGDRLFAVNGSGVLTCGNAATGEVTWRQRLKGRFWATPLVLGDLLWCLNSDGLGFVVRAEEKEGVVVGTSDFGEPIYGSPAYGDGALYVRGDKHLWKIAQP
jgi:outer membrane protein assembly factor BamB